MKYFTFISILVLLFSQPTMLWAGSYQNFIEMGDFFNSAGKTRKAYEKYLEAYANASTKHQKKTSLASLAVTSLKLDKRAESEKYLRKLLSLFPNNEWAMQFAKENMLLSYARATHRGMVGKNCYALWYERNLIAAKKGYCFSTSLGNRFSPVIHVEPKLYFLTTYEKRSVAAIGAKEKHQSCNDMPTDAGKAVLAFANNHGGFKDVIVSGIGRDSLGRWWIDAYAIPIDVRFDSLGFFVIFDGSTWTEYASGTGIERSDLPNDIIWEDVF